ncbi:fatty acid desaturase family protein [Thalassococcus sp. BH17M4-6]|uniref:fatty acid desaturase family protein n=1 Tax=Thalassococcus sp. BH17M4-6 TaxID=3413148 RepID=UPI003BD5BCC5
MSAAQTTQPPSLAEHAPPKQRDILRESPELLEIDNWVFVRKMVEHGVIWGAGAWLALSVGGFWGLTLGAILMGFVYARNMEIVHECIHNTAIRWKPLNTVFGILMATPMITSFAAWKRSHLQHHQDVRHEGFEFELENIRGVGSLLWHWLMIDNIIVMFRKMGLALLGRTKHHGIRDDERRDLLIMAAVIVAVVAVSVLWPTWIFVKLWLLPLIPASIFNFHIQLPEHFECDRESRDAFRNSRSVDANGLVAWAVNNNHLHVEHHWLPAVPIKNLPIIERKVRPYIQYRAESYAGFYARFYKQLFADPAASRTSSA